MKYIILLLALLLTTNIVSQSNLPAPLAGNGIIKGIIKDSANGSPLPFANITIHHSIDSLFITGVASGTNGEFILSNIPEGKYYLKVSFVGYQNKFIENIIVPVEKSELNVGEIQLAKDAVELAGTEVVGDKVSEEFHLDKKVINVSQDINSAGGTALDVLQNQPSIRVDPDGTVYLRGSSNFTILVNGKPSVLQGSDALRQISANMIETIEIITNPSARYDAEGTSGIININLKKQTEYSLSGIVNVNGGTRDKYNGDASFNYNINGMTLTGGFDYRDNAFHNNQQIDRISFSNLGTSNNSTELNIRDKRRQYSGRAGFDYLVDDNNSLSFSLSSGQIDLVRSLSAKVENINSTETVYAENVNTMDIPVFFFNSNFNYSYKIIPDVNDLMFEATYSNVSLPSEQLTNEYITTADFITRQPEPKRTNFKNDAVRNEGRFKLNYNHKLSETSKLELGVQTNYSYRKFDLVNRLYDWNLMDYTIDYNLTNQFDLRNNVYAGFISYTGNLLDFDYMLGLRGEYMDRLLEQKTLVNDYSYNKMDYFPSFSVSKKIDDHQLQFSYSRRVNRPNENFLNPFPFYTDRYLSSAGNPQLLPEYTNSYELNYQKMFGTIFLSVQTYFRNTTNNITQTFKVDTSSRLNTTFENFGKQNTYGTEISSSFSIAQIFRFDPSINLFGTDLNGTLNNQTIDKNFFNWTARLNTTVTITPDTRLQVSGNYFAKMIDAQNEIEPFFILTASIKQDLFYKALSVTLQARNILKTGYIDLTSTGSNFNSAIFVKPEIQIISLMLSYNFNNFKRTQRQGDNVDIQTGI